MALPFLPGYCFDRNLGKEKFHKSIYLNRHHNVPYVYGDNKPGIGGDPLPGQKIEPKCSAYPSGMGKALPPWLAFEKQCLSFDAYFQETVDERREEQYRVRKVKIYFYPEDDTIQVFEPRIANSGIAQGTIIRRQRIPRPPPKQNTYYTVYDLNVGKELTANGRVFRLVACDQFTANFLRKLGVQLGQPEPIPGDPYTENRKAYSESMQPLRPYERMDKLRQFLDHDRNVLRFYCCWDDTPSLYGDVRNMVLHYFLADDTIEIREMIPPNSGRDEVPCFLRRQKLPRTNMPLPLPGEITDRTLLNVFGHPQRGGHYILDSLKLGSKKEQYYTDRALTLGSSSNVYGRKFWLCDCDEFTKEYYRLKYGITDFTPFNPNLPASNKAAVEREIPPYNGWGSQEDSLANCHSFQPKQAIFDLGKFLELDRQPCESNCLRFLARLDPTDSINADRRFIISCYLFDDSLAIFEPVQHNSGFIGGQFLRRERVKKPGQERFNIDPPVYYKATDLALGTHIDVYGSVFLLEDADEYALEYMEANSSPKQFQQSHLPSINGKIKSALRQLGGNCLNEVDRLVPKVQGLTVLKEKCGFYQFQSLLDEIMSRSSSGQLLTLQEAVTLARAYSKRTPKEINVELLVGLGQHALHQKSFDDFPGLLQACQQSDLDQTGRLDRKQFRRICQSNRLPLPDDMLEALIDQFIDKDGDSSDQVDYQSLLNRINWRCHLPNPEEAENKLMAPFLDKVDSRVQLNKQYEQATIPCDFSGNLPVDWASVSRSEPAKSLGQPLIRQVEVLKDVEWRRVFADLCVG